MGISYGVFRSGYIQRRADRLKELRDKRIAARLEQERLAKLEAQKSMLSDIVLRRSFDFLSVLKLEPYVYIDLHRVAVSFFREIIHY